MAQFPSSPPWRVLLWTLLLAGGLWLAVSLLLPLFAPFGAAALLAALLERPVGLLCKKLSVPRLWAALLCTLLLALLVLSAGGFFLWRLWVEVTALARHLPALGALLTRLGGQADDLMRRVLTAAPIPLQAPLADAVERLQGQLLDLGSSAAGALAAGLVRWAGRLPGAVLALFTTGLATVLTSAAWPRLKAGLHALLPARWQRELARAGQALRGALAGWLRAQGILLALTFSLLAVGLALLGLEAPLLAAGLIALVDLLPVLGAGTVLLPWAVGALLWGRPTLAVGLAALYALLTLLRGVLEPRLVGKDAGLPPLAALAAMYAGFTAWGPAGMILAPIGAVMAKALFSSHRADKQGPPVPP